MAENEQGYVIGIDIGGTNFRIGRVSEDNRLYEFTIVSSDILSTDEESLKSLEAYIRNYTKKLVNGRLLGISIGFPSAVSKNKKVVYSSPNIKGFDDINVVDPLKEAFNVPVFIDNDVNLLLMYEITRQNLAGKGIILGFYIGTGFGNAVYINDDFLEGRNGVAAEFGHTPVLGKKDPCGCGNAGCIELYASGKRLEELNKEYFPDTFIKKVFSEHRNHAAIQEFIEALSVPIATEITIFDPDYVVLGGGVINMEDFPREDLEKYIYMNTRKPYPANNLKIIYAASDSEAGVLGAAYNAYKRLGKV